MTIIFSAFHEMGVQMQTIDPRESKRIFTTPSSIERAEYIIVDYYLVPNKNLSLEEAAARVALGTSLRSVTPLPHEIRQGRIEHSARILSVESSGHVSIAYPISICGLNEGLAQLFLMMSAAVEYDYTQSFWIEQIELPSVFVKRFRGPKFGVDGIRERFKLPKRPIIGVIPRPRLGASLSKVAELCRDALWGGADFIADDVLIVDPDGDMSFRERVPILSRVAREASSPTEEKWYVANIGTSPNRAVEFAKIAKDAGAGALMINGFTMGFCTVEEIAHHPDINLPIISTNMGVGLLTRPGIFTGTDRSTGVSEAIISTFSRIAGADGVHVGTANSGCYAQDVWDPAIVALRSPLHNIKPSFPVAGDELTVKNLWDSIVSLAPDVLVETSTGILGYPQGPGKAAHALRALATEIIPEMSDEEIDEKVIEIAQRDSIVRDVLTYYEYKRRESKR